MTAANSTATTFPWSPSQSSPRAGASGCVFGGYRFRTDCRSTSDFANEYEKIPSFGLFHVGVQYSPTCFGLDGLTLAFTVDNLFDKNYCDYSTYGTAYWPGAGRSYMFTVRCEF